jgi:L-ascorbate metabolism protein UlaG (beta-lactamase superfamily)
VSANQGGQTPKSESIAIQWFNSYSGVSIKTLGKTLVIDPCAANGNAFADVDTILITHEHHDHFDASIVGEIFSLTNCMVVADPTTYELIEGIPKTKLVKAAIGTQLKFGDVQIYVEKSHHPPAATPVTYMIVCENGCTIYHTSDSLPFTEMSDIGQRFKPDLTFCTIGIAPGASPRSGAEIAELVQPKVAVPYHGSRFSEFSDILANEAPQIKSMLMEMGKEYWYP